MFPDAGEAGLDNVRSLFLSLEPEGEDPFFAVVPDRRSHGNIGGGLEPVLPHIVREDAAESLAAACAVHLLPVPEGIEEMPFHEETEAGPAHG